MAAKRRLAVIMFTDMVGYSASSQIDESGTLARLREQEDLVRPLLAEYGGREIKSTGDGFLVEFDSALRAAQCAIEIQRRMHERNSQTNVVPVQLRIGIHLGDVEQHGHDIFGDAVNIAARVEPLADPGGVCLSGQVFDQVRNKIPNALEKLPPKNLKNLRFPIDVYRVALPWLTPEPESPTFGPIRLAVLPFVNMSPDPGDEYFADGLTEELITILSQLQEIRVIARTSVFPYKATSKSVSQIGSELGVTSILEGSVRKARDQIRITVQLIDVGTQEHAWASTYDRKLEDVFAVQTEVAKRIARVLKIKMKKGEETRLEKRPAVRPDSYLAYLKGRSLLLASWSKENFQAAKKQFELAISIDPTNARAYSGLADVTSYLGWGWRVTTREGWDQERRAYAARAIELDPGLAEAHCSLAAIVWDAFEYVRAEKEIQLALSIIPGYSFAHHIYAAILEDEGRADEALREHALAEECDPHSLVNARSYCTTLLMLRRLDEAKVKIERQKELGGDPQYYHWGLAFYYLCRSDLPRALQELSRSEELASQHHLTWIALLYAAAGEKEKAVKILESPAGKEGKIGKDADVAMVHALLGNLDECFRLMEKALEEHQVPLQVWRLEPMLEPARRDPRFTQILKRMNLA